MKKIKGILLFGILTLFGIGSSFAIDGNVFMSFQDNNGFANFSTWLRNGTYLYLTRTDSTNRSVNYYTRSSTFNTWSKIYLNYTDNIFDGNFCLFCSSPTNTSALLFGNYVGNNENRVLNSGDNFNFSYFITDSVYSGTNLNTGSINSYLYFNEKKIQSNFGTFTDIGNGLVRKKIISNGGGISSISIYDGVSTPYSSGYKQFSFIPSDGFIIDDYGNGVYNLNVNVYSGFLLTHFQSYNSSGYISQVNTILLSFYSENIYYNIYTGTFNKYSQLTSNSPIYRGILYSNGSNGYNDFMTFIYDVGSFVEVLGSYSDGITFRSFWATGYTRPYTDYTFTFNENSSVPDILNPIPVQSTGSIAINTGLLNACLNDLTFGELNSYLCTQLLSHLGNPIQIPGTSGQYISVSIDENGNLRYWITTQEDLEEQMSGFVWVENDDGTRSTVCPSGDCLGTVLTQPINHGNTGFDFTTGIILDMITNLTGWVGRCPFPYTDFRLGKNTKLLQLLQSYGFDYDPFIFANCAIAGFHYGRHSIDRQIFDDTFEHPLLYGDTQKHRSLFVFLDFIVILGLLGLSAFLKKIF